MIFFPNQKQRKVLLIVEQCNPDLSSVPLEGYNFYHEISQIVDVTLVTHERNRQAIEQRSPISPVVYIPGNAWTKQYFSWVKRLTSKGKLGQGQVNWPLFNALSYPIYEHFNQKVYQKFKDPVSRGEYDIVHAITPMMPRYAVKLVKACQETPFILGPVNGGVPFPSGFQEVAQKENARWNFLRTLGIFLVPGYRDTYQKATRILAGSTYTRTWIEQIFSPGNDRMSLFYENGIPKHFINLTKRPNPNGKVNLLFVGRLVPYKCPDVAIEAMGRLDRSIQERIHLTIVGEGPEKSKLETRVQELKIEDRVSFAGWVSQNETFDYYSQSDIFCFPSVREFGGAVVLEAMGSGLPCIVADNGGIGEYVNEENGFKIEPISREYITQEVTKKIQILVEDEDLRSRMSVNAIERAKEFVWENKAQQILEIYQQVLQKQKQEIRCTPDVLLPVVTES